MFVASAIRDGGINGSAFMSCTTVSAQKRLR
jgi:hypothetical protein